jgi:hypothetical protein
MTLGTTWSRILVATALSGALLAGVLLFPVDRRVLALVGWIRGAGAGGATVFAVAYIASYAWAAVGKTGLGCLRGTPPARRTSRASRCLLPSVSAPGKHESQREVDEARKPDRARPPPRESCVEIHGVRRNAEELLTHRSVHAHRPMGAQRHLVVSEIPVSPCSMRAAARGFGALPHGGMGCAHHETPRRPRCPTWTTTQPSPGSSRSTP